MKISRFGMFPLLSLCAATNAYAGACTQIDITGTDDLYKYSLSDLISSIPTPVSAELSNLARIEDFVDAVNQGCAKFNWWGITLSGDGISVDSNAPEAITKRGIKTAFGFATNGISWNGIKRQLLPTFKPCGPVTLYSRFAGNLDAYVFHIGTGPYPGKKREIRFTSCDTIIVETKAAATLELPWSIAGSVLAAESFGDPDKTFCKASLSLTGSLLGQSLSEHVEVESVTVIPEEAGINKSSVATISVGPGRHEFTINYSGVAKLESRAMSTGFFGTLSGAANGGVMFPDTIKLSPFQGVGGTALPSNVRISSKDDTGTFIYADTYTHPSITGPIAFQGWVGPALTSVAVYFVPDGESYSTYLHNARVVNGSLQALAPDAGKFAMIVGNAPYLRKRVQIDTTSGNASVAPINLIAGDINGDNYIGTDDYLILNSAFDASAGDSNFDELADLTGDGYIGTDDYLLLNGNFDITGDE